MFSLCLVLYVMLRVDFVKELADFSCITCWIQSRTHRSGVKKSPLTLCVDLIRHGLPKLFTAEEDLRSLVVHVITFLTQLRKLKTKQKPCKQFYIPRRKLVRYSFQ
jgi:hypothetical protein